PGWPWPRTLAENRRRGKRPVSPRHRASRGHALAHVLRYERPRVHRPPGAPRARAGREQEARARPVDVDDPGEPAPVRIEEPGMPPPAVTGGMPAGRGILLEPCDL